MNMSPIGLRFLLAHGSFLSVTVPLPEASAIIEQFSQGQLRGVFRGPGWAVQADQVIGLHTFALEPAAATTPAHGYPPALTRASGAGSGPWFLSGPQGALGLGAPGFVACS